MDHDRRYLNHPTDTSILCEGCGHQLCMLCAFNGYCQECATDITPEQYARIDAEVGAAGENADD